MKNYWLYFFIIFPITAFATIGGPHDIQTLGYDSTDVYFLYSYHDESDRSPVLWKYNLATESFSFDYDWSHYPDEEIEDGIRRMGWDKLSVIPFDSLIKNEVIISNVEVIDTIDPYTEENYQIYVMDFLFKGQHCILQQCYDDHSPELINAFIINDTYFLQYRYKGLCFETGYDKDTVFVFSDQIISESIQEDSLAIKSSIDTTNTPSTENEEEKDTYWEKGSPNFIYIFLPIILIIIPIVILKWKKKDETDEN